jgi:predicted dithiol-disulfide oxidoreductase (DUF899 family)
VQYRLTEEPGGTLITLRHTALGLLGVYAFTNQGPGRSPQIAAFKKRMGWGFQWVSSNANGFNYDFHVSFAAKGKVDGEVNYNYLWMEFPSEEAPGLSVFYKNADGEIFHTYSTYGRGLDILLGAYNFLDMTPKGRDEDGLAHTMAWVRHHDRYDDGYGGDASAEYQQPETIPASSDSSCCHETH